MSFNNYLKQVSTSDSPILIEESWMQGRAAFGGLGAALVFEKMKSALSRQAPVRCLQISFVGPITNEPLDIESTVLREGKSVSQVMGFGKQNGEVKIAIQGSFGAGRDSSISVNSEPGSLSKAPDQCQKLPYIPGVMPAFTQHFDFQYATPFPFSGGKDQFVEGYVRFDKADFDSITEAHLLALVDTWPPATLPLLKTPAAASSLSWTIEFIHPQPRLVPDEYTLYRADIVESSNGYGNTRAKIWNEAGDLLAISQQTVTHFA